jgi:hypothetical protein
MTSKMLPIDVRTLVARATPVRIATAYPSLPVDPVESWAAASGPSPRPQPSPGPTPSAPTPGGPAYPSLPVEPDTRDGNPPGERK